MSGEGSELLPPEPHHSASPVIYADFDFAADIDPVAFDVRKLNGKIPAITAGTVYFWPLASDESRKACGKHARALLKRGVACRIIEAAPPASDQDVQAGIDAALVVGGSKAIKPSDPDVQRPSYLTWQAWGLDANERGPYATESNALLILAQAPEFSGRIWLDEFSQRLMIDDEAAKHGCREFARYDAISALAWMQRTLKLPKMGLAQVERAALLIGHQQKRHPVKEWFDSLEWDGRERNPTWISDAYGADQNEFTAAIGTNFLVQMVARVMEPGCKADHVLIIEGQMGIKKSSSLRALIGDRWFSDGGPNPIRKETDFLMATQGKLLMEIPEIHRYLRGEQISDMVALVSKQEDPYRAPYAPTIMTYPRQCTFCGTTEKHHLYDDPHGARRWWQFLAREVNMDYIYANREQLWAEAIARYERGEKWHLVPAGAARDAQDSARIGDEWEAVIGRYINYEPVRYRDKIGVTWTQRPAPLSQVTSGELLEHALGIDPGRWTEQDQRRVRAACAALGWRQAVTKIDRRSTRVWRVNESRPLAPAVPPADPDEDVPY